MAYRSPGRNKRDGTKKQLADFLSDPSGTVLARRNVTAFLVSMALVSEVYQMTTVVLNQPQFQKCGATDKQIGLLFLLLTICEMTGRLSARITKNQ